MIHAHLCTFTALDDLKPSQRKDTRAVLAAIAKAGRFSVFEATQYRSLAMTLDRIFREGLATTDTESIGYPWTKVALTDAGRALLAETKTEDET